MFSSPAAFPADANEQLEYSSSIWSSYVPHVTPLSGVYDNCWNDYYYSPVYYEQHDFAYQPVYFNNVVYYGFYEYPVATYSVPVFDYPVPATYNATFIDSPEVPSEYDDEHAITHVNDFGYPTFESRDVSVNNYAEKEICSDELTSLEMYYEEAGERLNDAPFKNYDDKDENKDDDSTSYESESKSKEGSRSVDVDLDKEHALLDLCAEFMKNSLPDNDKDSSSSEEDFCSDEESSSSDSDNDNFTALKRYGNFTNLEHLYNYPHSASFPRLRNFVVRGIDAHSSSDIKFCRKAPDTRKKHGNSDTSQSSGVREDIGKDKSNVTSEVHSESGQHFMDMILASEEYLGIQDKLENTKLYRDHCYKLLLKKNPRRKEAVLLDVLPTLIEESSSFEDVTDESSVDDAYRTGNQEVVSHNEHEPIITKMKQPKRRFKSIKKWFSKTFCCCRTTEDPP